MSYIRKKFKKMKFRRLLLLMIVGLSLLSCKKEEKAADAAATENQATADENVFVITLNATVAKDDSFQIYYKQDNDVQAPFEEKNSLYSEFKGSGQPQDIVFRLPKDVLPTMLRFDFGVNKEQTEIVVNSYRMQFNGKQFEIKGSDFFKYFYPAEEGLKFDAVKSTVKPFVKPDGSYDPLFNSQPVLNEEIAKLLG